MNKPKKKISLKSTSPKPVSEKQEDRSGTFVFVRENYIIMLIGLAVILLGFLLMIGGNSKDPNEFSYDIFNFRRMTLAPILVLAGYAIEVYAIMKKPHSEA